MSNKFGGVSWNSNIPSKPGIRAMFKCKGCNRAYKQEWTRDRHQKQCEQKNGVINNDCD